MQKKTDTRTKLANECPTYFFNMRFEVLFKYKSENFCTLKTFRSISNNILKKIHLKYDELTLKRER